MNDYGKLRGRMADEVHMYNESGEDSRSRLPTYVFMQGLPSRPRTGWIEHQTETIQLKVTKRDPRLKPD